ncbi:MAG: hypothetical protein WA303_02710 [Bradyrhizobium sp.]|jgi:predicted RNA-binding Zn-ribbon protein involved in translation (DUF1610 family)
MTFKAGHPNQHRPVKRRRGRGFQLRQESGIVIRLLRGVGSPVETEDTMLQSLRPTPTCTRLKATAEMPCIKCGDPMRLRLVEPRNQQFDLLTYQCVKCGSAESFLRPM